MIEKPQPPVESDESKEKTNKLPSPQAIIAIVNDIASHLSEDEIHQFAQQARHNQEQRRIAIAAMRAKREEILFGRKPKSTDDQHKPDTLPSLPPTTD